MTRIRSFASPHKGLRNVMSQFSFRLGYTDFSDPSSLEALKKIGTEMFTLLNDHVHTENEHTLAQLEARIPGASAHDKHDHERLEKIQLSLEKQLDQFSENESPDDIHTYYLSFSKFHSEYLEHIYEEETVTELLLQKHFTDEEMIQSRISTMQRIKFPILLLWLKYIIPAQNEQESLAMLTGLKKGAPPEAFQQVLAVIQKEMDAGRFDQLINRLEK